MMNENRPGAWLNTGGFACAYRVMPYFLLLKISRELMHGSPEMQKRKKGKCSGDQFSLIGYCVSITM